MAAPHIPSEKDLARILYSEDELDKRIRSIAEDINRDYAGKTLILIGILKGASLFMVDLIKRLTMDVRLEFMAVSSYGAGTKSTGVVKIIMDTRTSIENQHVLVVEDIVDSGLTLQYLMQLLQSRKPASLGSVVLLRKPESLKVPAEDVRIKYYGFDIANEFVVGYGLDYAEMYRHLPYIGVLDPKIYTK